MSLTDNLNDRHAQLAALRASEVELVDGPDAALEALGPPADPIRMRAVLGILIRADRCHEAADLVRDLAPHEEWIDLAAHAHAVSGDLTRARSLVDRADEYPELRVMRRTRLAFAEGVVERWRLRCDKGSLLATQSWTATDIDLAITVIDLLDPLLSLVRANRRIQGDLQLSAVQHAVCCAHVAGQKEDLKRFAARLIQHTPIPLMVAELSLQRLVECPSNLPTRLRVEHSGDFQARFLAAVADRELLGHSSEAFDAFVQLSKEAATDDEKESVCVGLFVAAGDCLPEKIAQAIEVVTDLRPDDTRLIGLLHVFEHVANNQLDKAEEQLTLVRDETDAVWWQAHARLAEMKGYEDVAQAAWEKASELLPHHNVIRRSVQASMDRRKFESAIRSLKKLLLDSPNSEQDLKALAHAFFQLGDYAQAVEPLQQLVSIDSANADYRIWLAQSLARSARVSPAIEVLRPVLDWEEPPIDVILLQSELLESDNRPTEGLRLLDAVAADHWDDPRFLLAYMGRAHRAEEEPLAHEAYERLVELRGEGKVPSELMQPTTLEQLLEHGREFQNRRETLQAEVVGGRIPWLFVEDVLGNPPTWAWMLHTQELKWVSEERLSRAAFSVYATNGFTVRVTEEGKRIEPITAIDEGTAVVADLSALVTLHELGQLSNAAEFVGELILPASYGDLRQRDAGRFGQHQPSRETELRKIRDEIERGRIRVVEPDAANLPCVDEYRDEPGQYLLRIQDLIPVLQSAQKTSPQEIEELRRVAHKPSMGDEQQPALSVGAELLVDLATLRTLANQAQFETVLGTFGIHLRACQQEELAAELQAHEQARAARTSHEAMWEAVAKLSDKGKVKWVPLPLDTGGVEEEEREEDEIASIYLDSVRLSQHIEKALVVDDRVLQVDAYRGNPTSTSVAFGSDQLILKMYEAGKCSREAAGECFRNLMRWRYRFLTPPPSLLLAWARQSVDNLPGDALLDVAAYLHDCLRDPGLHCGLEQSDPPMPMAAKLVTAWIDSIGTFLANVWNEAQFTDESATNLTRWVAEEFIPSCPKGLWWHPVGVNLARIEAKSTLTMAMVKFTEVREARRANQGLRVLAQGLGLTDDEFLTAAVEATNAVRR